MIGEVIRVTVAQTKGSTPREAGAEMLVWQDGQSGSIGGGVLEYQAMMQARQMLVDGVQDRLTEQALGPELGQCCGGHVVLAFKRSNVPQPVVRGGVPIWIFGAGHVGRALATTLAPIADFNITLIDTEQARMPANLPEDVTPLTNANMPSLVAQAPLNARHFIMTMSHGIDLELCDALLNHSFDFAGLIGSKTKWARFGARLAEMGHPAEQIKRITCPIGEPMLGKEPQAIAVGISRGLLLERAKIESTADATGERGI
ncbi:xanthine dehydrogenase accessory protein XdhC [Profundibacter sp.]